MYGPFNRSNIRTLSPSFLPLSPSFPHPLSFPSYRLPIFVSLSLSRSLSTSNTISSLIATTSLLAATRDRLRYFLRKVLSESQIGAARIDRRINRPIDTKRCGYRTMQRHASSRPPMPPSRRQTKRMPDTYNRSRDAPNK